MMKIPVIMPTEEELETSAETGFYPEADFRELEAHIFSISAIVPRELESKLGTNVSGSSLYVDGVMFVSRLSPIEILEIVNRDRIKILKEQLN